ncbi:uncharacterized protein ACNLHF_025006 [Anomaloglossus baeobatrachus]|uniref:uncharacterized protein LOC142246823 n=1 Tax=Anomaloglossus baeobatrachus TaxID=238106 RepID=UPI003F50AE69
MIINVGHTLDRFRGELQEIRLHNCQIPSVDQNKKSYRYHKGSLVEVQSIAHVLLFSLWSFRLSQYHKVGIFSRSSEIDYEWLKKKLESEYFRDAVENVQSYYISNRGFNQFMTNVSNCTFGILYHTKNRGRINITDVTDSLYDEELDYMSRMMNRNVIVVVDDLNNGDNEEKSRILRSQPSIKEKALDMFLFTAEEKKYLEPLMKLRNVINGETIKENE